MPDADRRETQGATAPMPSEERAGGGFSKHRVLVTTGVIVLAVLIAVIGCAVSGYRQIASRLVQKDPEVRAQTARALDPTNAVAKENPEYILMLGVDDRPGDRPNHAGTIVILRLDADSKRVSMLSIPGNTRVSIPDHGMDKIENANSLGGPALTVKTVKEYTRLPIHHYIETNLAGLAEVVDSMGGVWLDVDKPIRDAEGIVAGVSDVTYIPAGRQKLNGAEALTYVRSQAFPNGDFTRVQHQLQFLRALIKRALQRDQLTRLPGVAVSAAEHVKTDMSVTRLVRLAELFQGLSGDAITGYTAPGTYGWLNGESYILPDAEASRALFLSFRGGVESTPAP